MLDFITYFLYFLCVVISVLFGFYMVSVLNVTGILTQILVGIGFGFLIFIVLMFESVCLIIYLTKINDTLYIKRINKQEREAFLKELEEKEKLNNK